MGQIGDMKKIEKLFNSELTSYRIAKDAGMNQKTLWNMREGKTDMGRIEFDNAILLTDIYDKFKEEGMI